MENVVTKINKFWKEKKTKNMELKQRTESKTKECANFKFEVKSSVK